MSAMGAMPMPGGWTMSMAWTRMPGQTWSGAAASFLGMWVVMMVAMMLPSLAPMLWRYRQAVGRTGGWASGSADRAGGRGVLLRVDGVRGSRLCAGRRAGGDRDATAGAGARRTDRDRCARPDRRFPTVHCVEDASPRVLPRGARSLPCTAGRCRRGLATRPAPWPSLRPLLFRSDGDPLGSRSHGPSRDGGRDGSHHRRTARTGR